MVVCVTKTTSNQDRLFRARIRQEIEAILTGGAFVSIPHCADLIMAQVYNQIYNRAHQHAIEGAKVE